MHFHEHLLIRLLHEALKKCTVVGKDLFPGRFKIKRMVGNEMIPKLPMYRNIVGLTEEM